MTRIRFADGNFADGAVGRVDFDHPAGIAPSEAVAGEVAGEDHRE